MVAAGEDYKAAAQLANGLAQKLLPSIETNPRLKEIYLQCDYLIVENVYRQSVKVKAANPNGSAELLKTAASLEVELARKQLGFVTDATRDRFRELMDAEPDLKAAFLDAYVPAVEAMEKQAEAVQVVNEQRDRPMRDKAFSDAASLIVDLEKMWPDYGNAAAQGRIAALLGNTELKAAYDKQKGIPCDPLTPDPDPFDEAIMKRIPLAVGLAACFGLFAAASARADDTVVRRDKSGKDVILSGTLVDESPTGVKLKVGKDTQVIAPDDIVDIGYAVPNVSDIEFRTPHAKEQDALGQKGADRTKGLAEALADYQALLKQVKGTANAERFIRYRMAMVAVEQATDDPSKRRPRSTP